MLTSSRRSRSGPVDRGARTASRSLRRQHRLGRAVDHDRAHRRHGSVRAMRRRPRGGSADRSGRGAAVGRAPSLLSRPLRGVEQHLVEAHRAPSPPKLSHFHRTVRLAVVTACKAGARPQPAGRRSRSATLAGDRQASGVGVRAPDAVDDQVQHEHEEHQHERRRVGLLRRRAFAGGRVAVDVAGQRRAGAAQQRRCRGPSPAGRGAAFRRAAAR